MPAQRHASRRTSRKPKHSPPTHPTSRLEEAYQLIDLAQKELNDPTLKKILTLFGTYVKRQQRRTYGDTA